MPLLNVEWFGDMIAQTGMSSGQALIWLKWNVVYSLIIAAILSAVLLAFS